MDINSCVGMARTLMTEHGVGYLQFGFSDAIGPSGKAGGITQYALTGTRYLPYKITLSLPWVNHLPDFKVREIILHEIAHAKSPWGTLHGPEWQDHAIKLGIPPTPRFDYPTSPWSDNG